MVGKGHLFRVQGPMGERVQIVGYAPSPETVVFDLCEFFREWDPLFATTYGVGELLLEAMVRGGKHIVLVLPERHPLDGGMGLLEALGVRFFDAAGRELTGMGENLKRVASLDLSGILKKPQNVRVTLALGEERDEEALKLLCEDLFHFARLLFRFTGEQPPDVREVGGIGMGLGVVWGVHVTGREEMPCLSGLC
ncbi:glycerate kinase [Candidatus Caldatribacterium saccharofermentans]|uniref:glycerate kinase n=1 Tax=Candidatus Caldatribacterium saccharofermentans TaxID=1454753 RepID=UPI003D079F80